MNQWLMKLRHKLLISLLAVCSQPVMSSGLDSSIQPSHVMDGTYQVSICKGQCENDQKKASGLLVIDRTKRSFPKKDEATQFVLDATAAEPSPNYCYFFDPSNKNNMASTLGLDPVNFGEMRMDESKRDIVPFLLSSPDSKLRTVIQRVDNTGFIGSWSSLYAGNPRASTTNHADYHLEAKLISPPDSSICYDAIPVHRKQELQMFRAIHTEEP